MSVRELRIWRRTDSRQTPAILIQKNNVDCSLLLQNGSIATLDSDSAEVERRSYTKIMDSYGIMGVLRITEHVLVAVTGVLSVGQLYGADIVKVISCDFISLRSFAPVEYIDPRIVDLQRLLSSGMFYFSSNPRYDITLCAQRRSANRGSDQRFFWNRSLYFPFERFGIDTSQWLLKCIVGSVLVRTVYIGHRTGRVALLSRLSCERVGTRFNVRGVNSNGCVANFVETEQVIVFDDNDCSFVQIRGSVPLSWEQPGVQVGSHKVKLRAFEASVPAFQRHFSRLITLYGKTTIVNLLGRKEGERILSDAFKTQYKNSKLESSVDFFEFDYHYQMKISKDSLGHLLKKLAPTIEDLCFNKMSKYLVRQQSGVLRVNCLDCLDRTNSVQTAVGLMVSSEQVDALGLNKDKVNVSQRIEEILRDLWQKNGDLCSNIYAGTGALDGKSKLKDASRSIARTIQNNLMDSSKQESFDIFLSGTWFDSQTFDRAANILPSPVLNECEEAVNQVVGRVQEITSPNSIRIFVGTWNVNGGKNMHNIAFRNESNVTHWIFSDDTLVSVEKMGDTLPEIIAIGLEELVDLNASNVMKARCGLFQITVWDGFLFSVNNCFQVGVCLFIFVRPQLAPYIKDFSVNSVKTGMGGATGNKGSVAFRMVVHSTSFCFVCSHFAAGQNEVRDRNEDFTAALRKIRFPQGREIESHDVIFWFGDFNYRINLSGDEVKKAVQSNDLTKLWSFDQLSQQKAQGLVFDGFQEGVLSFAPTYKYDIFSDDYDTSEKCRVPAWTDRILWRERRDVTDTKLIRYFRSELKTSDHRPVGAIFSVNTYRVNQTKCISLVEDIVAMHVIVSIAYMSILGVFVNGELHIVLESGEAALAALSMDGIRIDDHRVSVRLRSPDWTEHLQPKLTKFASSLTSNDSVSLFECDLTITNEEEFDFDGLSLVIIKREFSFHVIKINDG
uniref:phosphoinositide 5-phosphatase n=1 Tax=Angiostrongylus cantonensis TaxID=6313 RepID=A0A158PBJ9_ANGCA